MKLSKAETPAATPWAGSQRFGLDEVHLLDAHQRIVHGGAHLIVDHVAFVGLKLESGVGSQRFEVVVGEEGAILRARGLACVARCDPGGLCASQRRGSDRKGALLMVRVAP